MAASLEKEATPHQHFSDDDDTSDEDPGDDAAKCLSMLALRHNVLVMFRHEADVNSMTTGDTATA